MSAIVVLAAVFGLFQATGVSKDASDIKELYRLEEVWNSAHVKGDADALDKLWADDLIVTIAAMPVMKKSEALAMVTSNRMPFTKYETSELAVRRERSEPVAAQALGECQKSERDRIVRTLF